MAFRPRVVIVEDDPDILLVLRINLELAGFNTSLAADGATGLRRIESERPDLVLLDLMLPGLDGWSVLAELGSRQDGPPVVVCSAKHGARDIERAERLGATGFVTKPFQIDRVIEVALETVQRHPVRGTRPDSEELTEGFPIAGIEPA